MTVRKKVCMIGSFAVGKTSLVSRFVHSIFSDRYQTTIGVRVDKKIVSFDGREVTLVLWDVHGEDEFQRIRESYLRGAAGYLLVADGSRAATLDTALALDERVRGVCGDVPATLLVNKFDLRGTWSETPEAIRARLEGAWDLRFTSAKSGDGVEAAFVDLARRMAGE